MPDEVMCPLCRLRNAAREFVKAQNAEEACSCAKAPLALMALPMRVGCALLAAGSFLFLHGLYRAKSFVDCACPCTSGRPSGADGERKEDEHGRP